MFDTLDNGNFRVSDDAIAVLAHACSSMNNEELMGIIGVFVAFGEFNPEDRKDVVIALQSVVREVMDRHGVVL